MMLDGSGTRGSQWPVRLAPPHSDEMADVLLDCCLLDYG